MVGICVAVLSGLSSGCSKPKPKGNLAFVGLPAASGSSFVFTLTNTGDTAVIYLWNQTQIQSGGAWSNVWSTSQTNVTPAHLLSPRQSSQVTVAAPVGGAPWRLAVLWMRPRVLTPWLRVELAAQRIFTPNKVGLRADVNTNFSAVISPLTNVTNP